MTVKPKTYSVSRLKKAVSCAKAYEHVYILKTPHVRVSESTLTGNFCHDALELLHTTEDDSIKTCLDAFKVSASISIGNRVLPKGTDPMIADQLAQQLLDASVFTSQLYKRASASYRGKDAIRKNNGDVASKPKFTTGWKKASKELGIEHLEESVNSMVWDLNIQLRDISVYDAFTRAYTLCEKYVTPDEISKVISVEMPISEWDEEAGELVNPVLTPTNMGAEEGIYAQAFIDLVALTDIRGVEALTIIDYKTSQESVTPDMVKHNAQLNIYAYLYEALKGEEVKRIAINELEHGKFVCADLDRTIMIEQVKNLFSVHSMIKQGWFKKHTPDSKYSPCLNSFGNVCPFLSHCWPDYQQS